MYLAERWALPPQVSRCLVLLSNRCPPLKAVPGAQPSGTCRRPLLRHVLHATRRVHLAVLHPSSHRLRGRVSGLHVNGVSVCMGLDLLHCKRSTAGVMSASIADVVEPAQRAAAFGLSFASFSVGFCVASFVASYSTRVRLLEMGLIRREAVSIHQGAAGVTTDDEPPDRSGFVCPACGVGCCHFARDTSPEPSITAKGTLAHREPHPVHGHPVPIPAVHQLDVPGRAHELRLERSVADPHVLPQRESCRFIAPSRSRV